MIEMDEIEAELRSVAAGVTDHASVRSVFGEPIEVGERTVVPVARVVYGFGAGFGGEGGLDEEGTDIPIGDASEEATDEEREARDDEEPEPRRPEETAGGGGGGGAIATPVGVVEITEEGTRFVRFDAGRRLATAALGGVGIGLALGIGLASSRRRRAGRTSDREEPAATE